jgi:hypothetical protein
MPVRGTALKIEVLHGGKLFYDQKALQKVMMAAGREVAAQARTLIARKLPKNSKQRHVVSQAGSPPNSITGTLRKSITVRAFRKPKIGARVVDTAFYAKFLEVGAKGGGGRKGNKRKKKTAPPAGVRVLQPHPFISTAMSMKRSSIDKRVKGVVRDGLSWVREP